MKSMKASAAVAMTIVLVSILYGWYKSQQRSSPANSEPSPAVLTDQSESVPPSSGEVLSHGTQASCYERRPQDSKPPHDDAMEPVRVFAINQSNPDTLTLTATSRRYATKNKTLVRVDIESVSTMDASLEAFPHWTENMISPKEAIRIALNNLNDYDMHDYVLLGVVYQKFLLIIVPPNPEPPRWGPHEKQIILDAYTGDFITSTF